MMYRGLGLALAASMAVMSAAASAPAAGLAGAEDDVTGAPNVLIVFHEDMYGQAKSVAMSIAAGAQNVTASANVRVLDDTLANYKRDVLEWADALVLGGGVYNGNAPPALLSFINSFDFMDDLSGMVGGAFATGGSAAAGIQPSLEQLTRGLSTFRLITVGGDDWRSGEGTGIVVNGTDPVARGSDSWELGFGQGARVASVAAALKRGNQPPPPNPPACLNPPCANSTPPAWGSLWAGAVSANVTQVGFDAGLVLVNFTQQCGADASKQQMRTVYGDFYTVLTRCDLGYEFTIAPASRGGACTARHIGRDVDARICSACGCPFCVRDTNGTFAASGVRTDETQTLWQRPQSRFVAGRDVIVYSGRSQGTGSFDLETAIAYDARDGTTPVFVNISHPLWVSTSARIDDFTRNVDMRLLDVPDNCVAPSRK